jgi:uncharacterized protein (TIGR03000 family)
MLLAIPGEGVAGGGGHGGGGHGGGGHAGAGHGAGVHGGHFGPHGFHHGFHGGFGFGVGFGWGYDPWYGYGWGYPWYGYGYGPYPWYGPGCPGAPDFVSGLPPVNYQASYPKEGSTNASLNQSAGVEVSVPSPDAEVWLNGVRMKQAGTLRQYVSPPLKEGESYAYDLRVQWTENGKPVVRTQTVRLQANRQVKVDLASAAVVAPDAPSLEKVAHLDVAVPMADADVWLNGVRMKQTGVNRQYESPPLKVGATYSYEIRARWTENGKAVERTQTVRVQASKQIKIDLTNPVIAANK